ncbi:MAG: UDP-glucose 4-epimerase, partial [Candidatus Azotimanducaceae bacterium]
MLVVGGAGYIGSHMVKYLSQMEHNVITLDNLLTGCQDAAKYGQFIEGDIADSTRLNLIFSETQFD